MSLQIRLYNSSTIKLSNKLVPDTLKGKTIAEKTEILKNDHKLLHALNLFAIHTDNAKSARGQGKLSSPQRVTWKTSEPVTVSICPYDLIALNYLVFTGPITEFGQVINLALEMQNHLLKRQCYNADRKFYSHPRF